MKIQKVTRVTVLDQSPMFVCGVMHRLFRNRSQVELSRNNTMTLEMLRALAAVEEFQPMSQQELADAVLTERSVAKRMVDNLIKRDLIEVSKSDTNQKIKLLSLTAEGEQAVKIAQRTMENIHKEFFSCLSESEAQEFFRMVRKLAIANSL